MIQEALSQKLDSQFPKKVILVPKNNSLFHGSKNLRDLLNRNKFDYRRSLHEGSFYFTDSPTMYTNCQVVVNESLILFSYGQLSEDEIQKISMQGNGNLWTGGMNLGFDGRIFPNPDAFVKTADGRYAAEIVVFPKGLAKLGEITAFPLGSERTLYKYMKQTPTSLST